MKKRILSILIIFSMVLLLSEWMGKSAKAINVQDTASILAMDGQWSREYWLTKNDDEHYYKIVIPADGYFSFKIMSYIDTFCYYNLYSSDMSEDYYNDYAYAGTETSPKSASFYTSLSKGTYILKIHSNGSGRYKLQATYKNHHVNDANAISYDSPQALAKGNNITGALTESDREDWYRIKVPKTGYYNFFCKSYVDHSLYLELYSSDLLSTMISKYIYDGDETEPKTWAEDIVLKAGTYYIKLSGSLNATGRYVIKWDSLNQNNCTHSYKSKYIASTYTRRGYTLHTCEKCKKKYKDNYIAKKRLGTGYLSTFSYGGKGKIHLQWNTVYDASGYQVRYCKSKSMSGNVATKNIKGKSKYKCTIKNLNRKKKYYVQIRAYKKVGANTVYGKWSSKKYIKTT